MHRIDADRMQLEARSPRAVKPFYRRACGSEVCFRGGDGDLSGLQDGYEFDAGFVAVRCMRCRPSHC